MVLTKIKWSEFIKSIEGGVVSCLCLPVFLSENSSCSATGGHSEQLLQQQLN